MPGRCLADAWPMPGGYSNQSRFRRFGSQGKHRKQGKARDASTSKQRQAQASTSKHIATKTTKNKQKLGCQADAQRMSEECLMVTPTCLDSADLGSQGKHRKQGKAREASTSKQRQAQASTSKHKATNTTKPQPIFKLLGAFLRDV